MLYLLRESSTASLTCVIYLFIHVLSKSKEPLFQKAQEVEIQGFSSVQSRFPQVLWNEGFVDSVAHLRKPQETTDAGVEGWTSCVQRSQRKDLSYQNNEIFATSLKAKLWLTTRKCCGCKWLSLFKFLFFSIFTHANAWTVFSWKILAWDGKTCAEPAFVPHKPAATKRRLVWPKLGGDKVMSHHTLYMMHHDAHQIHISKRVTLTIPIVNSVFIEAEDVSSWLAPLFAFCCQ